MPRLPHSLLSYLRIVAGAWRDDPRDDAELLARFADSGDEAAFKALVCRYCPLVWRSCTRVLGDGPDAEDAFQTAFLALAHKAGQLRREPLAGWLHRVARQAALKVDIEARRRQNLELYLQTVTPSEVVATDRTELYAALDEELAGLPERLRIPLVLRYLEGKTLEDVARIVGCSRRAIGKRLAQGEALLRERLEQRGLEVGIASVGALLGSTFTASAVPTRLIGSTARAAVAFRSGALTGGAAEAVRAVLGALPASLEMTIMQKSLWIVLACCLGLTGVALVSCRTLSARPGELAAADPALPQAVEQPGQDGNKKPRTDLYGDPLPPGALARMGTVRFRHHFLGVRSVCFSPDGKIIASGGEDGQLGRMVGVVRLWEAATGKEIGTCQGHKQPVRSVCFSPDGKTLASGGWDGSVRLWDMATRKQIWMGLACPEHGFGTGSYSAGSVCFSPDGKILASGGRGGEGKSHRVVRLWDVATGKQIRVFQRPQSGGVGSVFVAFSPDGATLASGWSDDGSVRLWEVATGKQIRTWKSLDKSPDGKAICREIAFVAFSPDGKTLASGGAGGTVRLWDVATGKEIRTYEGHKQDGSLVSSVSFAPDGKTVASGGDHVRLWKTSTGKEICIWRQALGVDSVSFSPDGKRVASGGSFGGPVRLLEVATGKEVLVGQGHRSQVHSVIFSPDGKTLASVGSDYTARLWDMATSKQISVCQEKLLRPSLGGVLRVAFTPDGKTLVLATNPSAVRLWEVDTGRMIRTCAVDKKWLSASGCFSLSPDGKTLASLRDTFVHLWDVATGKEIHHFPKSSKFTTGHLAFSLDGKTLALAGADPTAQLWEVATGKELRSMNGTREDGSSFVSFSPDGKILASEKDNDTVCTALRLWEVATGKQIRIYQILSEEETRGPVFGINSVCFSPHGQTLVAVGGSDGAVRLFETATGKKIRVWRGHQGPVTSVSFSPDGRTLASASADTTVLLWKAPEPTRLVEKELSPQAIQQQWTALAGQDADRAFQAIHTLSAVPRQALPLLQERLRPVPPFSAKEEKRIIRLLGDLDNDQFVIRQKAMKELEKIIEKVSILPALRQALRGQVTLEKRRRLEGLIERATQHGPLPPEELRALRSLQVLEQIGTVEVREVLEKLARGNPGARLTQEAQASLKRLTR